MKYLGYILGALKLTFLTLAIVCGVAAATLLTYRAIERKRIAGMSAINGPEAISSLEEVSIGGVGQWIQIRGWNKNNPVILFVHGGPGFTDMPFYYRFDTALENDFVVVHWDQRGAGKSYAAAMDPRSMNVEGFVNDTIELSSILKARFGKKIILAGHSWGSLIGILAVSRRPDLYSAYVGIGQVTSMAAVDAYSYGFALEAARKSKNSRAIRELTAIGPPPWADKSLFTERKWVTRFGGALHSLTSGRLFDIAALSPAYTLTDLYRLYRGLRFSMRLNGDMRSYDVALAVPELKVPALLITGRYDRITAPELVGAYCDRLRAPKKECLIFRESAHFPHWEEPEEFHEALMKNMIGDRAWAGEP